MLTIPLAIIGYAVGALLDSQESKELAAIPNGGQPIANRTAGDVSPTVASLGGKRTHCQQCNAEMSPDAKLCAQCGTRQTHAVPEQSTTSDLQRNWPVLAAFVFVVALILFGLIYSSVHRRESRNDATGDSTRQSFGDASCSAGSGNKVCAFVSGNVRWPSVIPDGERLKVLGRSAEYDGTDHGASWYTLRTEHGQQGYIRLDPIKCDGDEESCLMCKGDLESCPKPAS